MVLLVSTDSAPHVERLPSSEIFLEELKDDTELARKDTDTNTTASANVQAAFTSSSALNKSNDDFPTHDEILYKEIEEFLVKGIDEVLANDTRDGRRRFAYGPMMNAAVQSRYQVRPRRPVQSLYQVIQQPVQSFNAALRDTPQHLRPLGANPYYPRNTYIPRKRRKHARKVVLSVTDMYQNPQYMFTPTSPQLQASAQQAIKEVDAIKLRYQMQPRQAVQSLYQVMQQPVQSFNAAPREIPQHLISLGAKPGYPNLNPNIPRKIRKHAHKIVLSGTEMYQNPQYMLTPTSPQPQANAQQGLDSKYLLDLYLTKLKEEILRNTSLQMEMLAQRPMDVITVGPLPNQFTFPTMLPMTLSTTQVQSFPEYQVFIRDSDTAATSARSPLNHSTPPSSETTPQINISATNAREAGSSVNVDPKIQKFLNFVKNNRDLLMQFIASKRQQLNKTGNMGQQNIGDANQTAIQIERKAQYRKEFVGEVFSGYVPPLPQNMKFKAEQLNPSTEVLSVRESLALNVRRKNRVDDNLEALVGKLIATTRPNPLDQMSIETNTRKLSAREIEDENEARALLSSIVDRATSSAVLMRAHGSQVVTISPLQLDLAPAKGEVISKLRAKKRLCQRNVLYPEGPKYRANGKPYMQAYAGSKRDFASTNSPKVELPICCNCCLKSVLGCS